MNILKNIKNFFIPTKDRYTIFVSGVLKAGESTLVLYDKNIKRRSIVFLPYSSYSVYPEIIYVSKGKVTLTFKPQPNDSGIKLLIKI